MNKNQLKEKKETLKKYYYDVFKTERMTTYCINKINYIVELSNGKIITIEKPTIKKDFCYGYGQYGITDEQEEQEACRMQEIARTNYQYFMAKNLEQLNDKIEDLKNAQKVYIFNNYYRQSQDNILRTYQVIRYLADEDRFNMTQYENLEELSQEDINKIIEGLETVKKEFIKRLETYLKKFGLSKVHSWTYLVD